MSLRKHGDGELFEQHLERHFERHLFWQKNEMPAMRFAQFVFHGVFARYFQQPFSHLATQ